MADKKEKKSHLVIHTSTWNLGNTVPPVETFDGLPWTHWETFLHPHEQKGEVEEEKVEEERDLVVFSFQEIDRFLPLFEAGEEPWTQKLTEEMTADSRFVRLAAVRMEKILLLVFIRRPLLHRVRNLRTTFTKTGMGGLAGNKGGVTVRLSLMGREICIVGMHLAAHLSGESERIVDFESILEEQFFQFPDKDSDWIKILDHDYVIVAGDLNFRLDDIPRDDVIGQLAQIQEDFIINNNNNNNNEEINNNRRKIFDKLLGEDQLLKAFKEQNCFEGFEEAQIDFKPTYKFDKDIPTRYDESHKQRKPAWTDRVIWRVHPEKKADAEADADAKAQPVRPLCSIESRFYGSNPAFINSDHKPVISKLRLAVDEYGHEDVYREEEGASKVFDNVLVEAVERWIKFQNGVCRVTFPTGFEPGRRDWIGLFEADSIPHLKKYVTWYWVTAAEEEEEEEERREEKGEKRKEVRRLTFASKYLRSADNHLPIEGKHLLMYISEECDNVYGISPVFMVEPRKHRPSS